MATEDKHYARACSYYMGIKNPVGSDSKAYDLKINPIININILFSYFVALLFMFSVDFGISTAGAVLCCFVWTYDDVACDFMAPQKSNDE